MKSIQLIEDASETNLIDIFSANWLSSGETDCTDGAWDIGAEGWAESKAAGEVEGEVEIEAEGESEAGIVVYPFDIPRT